MISIEILSFQILSLDINHSFSCHQYACISEQVGFPSALDLFLLSPEFISALPFGGLRGGLRGGLHV